MSLFGLCEHKNLTAEYAEEMELEAADSSVIDDIDISLDESYSDALLEALEFDD